MKFYEYLETIYYNGNIEGQKNFTLMNQAQTDVAIKLIHWQRNWFKRYSTVKLIVMYFVNQVTGKWPVKVTAPTKPTIVKDNNDQVETTPPAVS